MLPSNHGQAQAQKERRITSLEIASISMKNHKELLRSIRNQELGWEKVTGRKFALSKYKDPSGRTLPMYEFTKAESLYIASKFDDVIRAKLVVRWMELEEDQQIKKRSITTRDDEAQLIQLLKQYIIPGDMNKIAYDLKVTRKTVNAVKLGASRSRRIMEVLVDRALYNKRTNRQLVIGYDQIFIRESIAKLSHEA